MSARRQADADWNSWPYPRHLSIDSFAWALGGALMMSLIGTVGQMLLRGAM